MGLLLKKSSDMAIARSIIGYHTRNIYRLIRRYWLFFLTLKNSNGTQILLNAYTQANITHSRFLRVNRRLYKTTLLIGKHPGATFCKQELKYRYVNKSWLQIYRVQNRVLWFIAVRFQNTCEIVFPMSDLWYDLEKQHHILIFRLKKDLQNIRLCQRSGTSIILPRIVQCNLIANSHKIVCAQHRWNKIYW